MNKIAIIHFSPIEIFPPVVNLINQFSKNQKADITVFTLFNHKHLEEINFKNIVIKRYNSPSQKTISRYERIKRHLTFDISVFISLIRIKPEKILYYEAFSVLPIFLYSFFINKKISILIHCHEYNSPSWYKRQTIKIRINHFLEKKFLFPKAVWISQTNNKRLSLLKSDFPNLKNDVLRIVPNYPPKSWLEKINNEKLNSEMVKFVYIGTLSLEYTFIREFCEWIKKRNNFSIDIFSFNLDYTTLNYLESLKSPNIFFHKSGIKYNEIPNLLRNYHIGLILYKAITINFKYNATNKLFEYLACDLDVWFPEQMLGCYEYITKSTYPQVKKVDFYNLESNSFDYSIRNNLEYKPLHFKCEDALYPLVDSLVK